jgi:hypothetical protein
MSDAGPLHKQLRQRLATGAFPAGNTADPFSLLYLALMIAFLGRAALDRFRRSANDTR